jgi:OmpA-OmpF porin, OOP family
MSKKLFLVVVVLSLASILYAQERHDSCVFVFDISESLSVNDVTQGVGIAKNMNSKFPDYVQSVGLLEFGKREGFKNLKPDWVFPVDKWERNAFGLAFDKLAAANGRTPLGVALESAKEGVDKAAGKVALIIISDGVDNGHVNPVAKIKDMKDKRGDKLCVFTIQLRNSESGTKLLDELVKVGACGKTSKASALMTDPEVQALVDFIFPYEKPAPTPEATPVPTPVDSDQDGVFDDKDKCPNTPKGAKVDAEGCWRLQNLNFEFDSAKLLPASEVILDEVVTVLKNNPTVKIEIEGHTDGKGSDEYNMKLSQNRADSVHKYLITKGIEAARLSTKGYGESKPIADNNTDEGRAQNRRIELTVVQ